MNPETLHHFGLNDWPFSKEIPDDALWLPPSKAPLVDAACEAILARQSILISGDAGVGKTCVLRAIRHRLTQPDIRLTYCHNVTLGRRDFYRQLCVALNLNPKATAAAVFHAVSTHVEELGRDQIRPVFFLDEAHLLHQDTLDHLHILLNYEWDSRPLLSLGLIGLPELEDRLALRRNRSLLSRLGARLRVEPLTPEDTADYVRLRLSRVGPKPDLFTADALTMLYEATLGNLRETDRIATGALAEAARLDRPRVERDIVSRVLARYAATHGATR